MKFAAVGSNCIDFYENLDGGTPFPGGDPVNMAVYAAEMGAQSAYVGPVGQDAFGQLLRRAVAEKGVDVSRLAEDLAEIEKSADAWAWDYAKKKTAFLKDHPDLPHYFIGAGNQYGAAYSYAMCYWEEQMWIRTKSISCPEFFHGMQEIIVADTPVTLFLGEDEQRPLAERVARFLPKVCSNYTIIDTKELPMPGISGKGKICGTYIPDGVSCLEMRAACTLSPVNATWNGAPATASGQTRARKGIRG